MKERVPLSDSALVLGALFVACTAVCVGLVADPQAAYETASVWNQAMVAASNAPAQSNPCLVPVQGAQTSDGKDFKCLPGCIYTVRIGQGSSGGFFSNFTSSFTSELQVIAKGTPSKTDKPLGQVFYMSSFGGTKGPATCSADGRISQTAQSNFNDLNTLSYHYVAGASTVGEPTNLIPSSWGSNDQSLSSALAKNSSTNAPSIFGGGSGNNLIWGKTASQIAQANEDSRPEGAIPVDQSILIPQNPDQYYDTPEELTTMQPPQTITGGSGSASNPAAAIPAGQPGTIMPPPNQGSGMEDYTAVPSDNDFRSVGTDPSSVPGTSQAQTAPGSPVVEQPASGAPNDLESPSVPQRYEYQPPFTSAPAEQPVAPATTQEEPVAPAPQPECDASSMPKVGDFSDFPTWQQTEKIWFDNCYRNGSKL